MISLRSSDFLKFTRCAKGHTVTAILLIALDSNWLGNWHARMMRIPTKMEMDGAHSIEGAGKTGSVGAPPIAMTEVQDEIVIEELKGR